MSLHSEVGVRYGHLNTKFGKYLRAFPVFLVLLLCASTASAATLCVDNDTLAHYIAGGSCYVNAGLGVQLLFTFDPTAFQYTTDGSTNVTSSDIIVQKVTGPGSPEAGLRFTSGVFVTPNDGTYADINLTFGVSIYSQPVGQPFLFTSAHLGVNDILAPDPNAGAIAVESEAINAAFNLQILDPSDPGNTPDATYFGQPALRPNVDLSINIPGTKITSWVESYDLTQLPEPGSLILIPGGLLLVGLLRKKRHARSVLPLVALFGLFAAKSHASAVCTDLTTINGGPVVGTSLGLDKYIAYSASFGGCTMNDMLFDFQSFTVSGTAGAGGTLATAANTKLVFTLNQNTGNNTNLIGIQYIPQATSTGTNGQTFALQYTVSAPLYQVTKMTGSTTATTNVTRTTTITPGATPSPSNTLSPNITLNNLIGTTLTVNESFTLSSVSGTKHISNLTETFTEIVPEPVTTLLIGSSLLGLGLLARKRRQP